MKSIKVLHISKYYSPYIGGIETVCRDCCVATKTMAEIKVFCFNDANKTQTDIVDGIEITRVGVQAKVASQPLSREYGRVLLKLITDFKPDVVHFHYPNPFAAHYVIKTLKKTRFKGKFILHWHADIVKQKFLKLFFVSQSKRLLEMADLVLATSPSYLVGTDFLPFYKNKVEILPLCIGESRTIQTPAMRADSLKIREKYAGKKIGFFFGRHVKYKGIEYLISANNFLDKSGYVFLIAGTGPLTKKLRRMAENSENIIFLGRLTDSEVNAYLLACDFFTFPSITRNEAFGISLAEALYYGKPAITFKVPGSGINWVSINNVTGYEAPNRDSKAYAELIDKLFNSKDYERLSMNAKLRAEEYFMPAVFKTKIVDIYRRLLGLL